MEDYFEEGGMPVGRGKGRRGVNTAEYTDVHVWKCCDETHYFVF